VGNYKNTYFYGWLKNFKVDYRAHCHPNNTDEDFRASAPDRNSAKAIKKNNPNARIWLYMSKKPTENG